MLRLACTGRTNLKGDILELGGESWGEVSAAQSFGLLLLSQIRAAGKRGSLVETAGATILIAVNDRSEFEQYTSPSGYILKEIRVCLYDYELFVDGRCCDHEKR